VAVTGKWDPCVVFRRRLGHAGIGNRSCSVSQESEQLATLFRDGVGLPPNYQTTTSTTGSEAAYGFEEAAFTAGDSWIEI
jgi:hypothetical protein